MLNTNINYPYPVIREYPEDYKSTVFSGNLVVRLEPDAYVIKPSFDIDNRGIAELLKTGELTYAIEVQCVSTWYRKLFRVSDNKPIRLNPKDIHERVELAPCIVAVKNIDKFCNEDFEDEYQGLSFSISTGDIIGIGQKRIFDALYQNDIIKNGSSIVHFTGDKSIKEISCDFSGSIIVITLPKDQYEQYTDCGYNRKKYKTLNAILTIPALVEAISIISSDEMNPDKTSGFENKAWYKTIVANLKRYAENDENKYYQMLQKPFASAEILLGNNYVSALQYISQAD